jgi:hypothetical protein
MDLQAAPVLNPEHSSLVRAQIQVPPEETTVQLPSMGIALAITVTSDGATAPAADALFGVTRSAVSAIIAENKHAKITGYFLTVLFIVDVILVFPYFHLSILS